MMNKKANIYSRPVELQKPSPLTDEEVKEERMKHGIWREVLSEICGKPNPITGNMPCDDGLVCDKCSQPWVQAIYERRLEEAGLK
jgi:hypothetical protein